MDWFSPDFARTLAAGARRVRVRHRCASVPGAPANEKDRRTVETFLRWQRRTLDLPGPIFWKSSTGSFVRTASPQAGSMRSAASSICVSCAARCFSSLAIETRSRRRDKSWRRDAHGRAAARCRNGDCPLWPSRSVRGSGHVENEWPRIARWLAERPVHEGKSPGTTRRSRVGRIPAH